MFVHLDGMRGLNIDLVAEWIYEEKKAGLARRAGKLDATSQAEDAGESCLRVHFAAGHVAEFAGGQADALHRYLTTKSRSLT